MGVAALYCRPNTSRRNAQHRIWPYLLRGVKIDRANRKILAHRVAITLEAIHAVEAFEQAAA